MRTGPRSLEVASSTLERLSRLAREAAPLEACGVLLGRREDERLRVHEARALTNPEREPGRFRLEPGELATVLREADSLGLEVLGAWHSHPEGELRPSARDARGTPEGWCQLVVGPEASRGARAAWRGAKGLEALEILPREAPGGARPCR